MEKEKWVRLSDIGTRVYYELSNHGNIRSIFNDKIKKLKPRMQGEYFGISFWVNKKKKAFYLHRLVAENFILIDPTKNQVNHIDGDKLNNHYTNLEWCTASENIKHAHSTGLFYCKNDRKEKISKENISKIKELLLQGISFSKIAITLNISRGSVSNINYNKKVLFNKTFRSIINKNTGEVFINIKEASMSVDQSHQQLRCQLYNRSKNCLFEYYTPLNNTKI
ncbi:MAG: hypothetical protein JWQ09_5839 [Segetibacter sp.]|nr:hypothetical protein [Segetibacter sp.]